MDPQAKYRVAIIIFSDSVSSGQNEDGCMSVFRRRLAGTGFEIADIIVASDDSDEIRRTLVLMTEKQYPLILTSGGTGCSPRDNTPEVTSAIIERPTPGIDEAIRRFSTAKSDFAMYSRAVSGFVNRSLIINLPGSPKAVDEILEFLLSTLIHPLELMNDPEAAQKHHTDGTKK